jgi:uncharacterized protein with HEPN domain
MNPENRTTLDYVDDMILYASDILTFADGLSQEAFLNDRKTIAAVIRCIEVLGEAAQQIPEQQHSNAPEIPWRKISGTRDRLIHDYMGVDTLLVWYIVQDEIPQLLQHLHTFRYTLIF